MAYPFFKVNSPVAQALFQSNRAKSAAAREFQEGPIEVLPGIFSTDPLFIQFKNLLSLNLTKAFPESVDEWGRVYGNGVRANFYSMRHVNGYPMIPATWPLASNLLKREKAGLTNGFSEQWHELLFEAFVRLVFCDLEPVRHKMKKGSSSCVPEFTTQNHEKEGIARQAYKDAEAAGTLMMKKNYKDAYLYYEMGGAYYVVYRAQSTDKMSYEQGVWEAGKRTVADFQFAISGGAEGQEFTADKSAPIDGKPLPQGFFRERRRTAQGIPGPIGAALTPIAQAARTRMYSVYAYTFHHTTRAQKEEKVHEWDFSIAADVSDHDAFYPSQVIDKWAETFKKIGFAEWWVELFSTSFKLPIYVSAPGPDQGQTLIGDWREPNLRMGLSSGNPFTDMLGSGNMCITYLISQIEHTAPHFKNQIRDISSAMTFLDMYMKGKLEIGQISKSDDAFLLWKKGVSAAAAHDFQRAMKDKKQLSDYMHIGYEHGGAFLGDILLYDSTKELKRAIFIGNILSMLRNNFSPEYGCDSHIRDRSRVKRPYPGLAWASMREVYGDCPVYREVLDVVEHTWRKVYGYSYKLYREKLLRDHTLELEKAVRNVGLSMGRSELTPIEIDVLNDPSRAQWRYKDDDIRPEVMEHLMHGLPLEEVSPYFESIIKG